MGFEHQPQGQYPGPKGFSEGAKGQQSLWHCGWDRRRHQARPFPTKCFRGSGSSSQQAAAPAPYLQHRDILFPGLLKKPFWVHTCLQKATHNREGQSISPCTPHVTLVPSLLFLSHLCKHRLTIQNQMCSTHRIPVPGKWRRKEQM